MISKSNVSKALRVNLLAAGCLLLAIFSGCYSFKDVSIPPDVKTARVNFIENKARYINPQLSPQLTDKLRQKVNNQTRLTLVQGDDAHYDIGGYVSDYSVTTSGISQQQAATNRLTVTVTVIFKNNLDPTKNFESPVSRSFEFPATQSLQSAEAQLTESIIQNMTDEIFNKIFSNW
ncbi:LPS assembly lipoprotein LptE [Pseudoflavitalea rhizosphaerae]|uniref:LPS assembly lipoprotein LptE n=1 Tax=Pseudoflavitalea rhizosphaerae TaxID=1884793 RepID=UPI000F8E087D|nr:LPS assembly lipoprotein LptE [Pseudoflavitalea rhizosphaerae]